MLVGSQGAKMEVENHKASSSTVSELISSLKSAFQNAIFSEVEAALISREETMKREIEHLREEIELLSKDKNLFEDKFESERLEKYAVQKECLDLKKERDGFIEKLKNLGDDKKTIVELLNKICDLECAKMKAKSEAMAYKTKFEELEARVLILEQDLKQIKSLEGNENVAADENTVAVKIEKDVELNKGPTFHELPDGNRTGASQAARAVNAAAAAAENSRHSSDSSSSRKRVCKSQRNSATEISDRNEKGPTIHDLPDGNRTGASQAAMAVNNTAAAENSPHSSDFSSSRKGVCKSQGKSVMEISDPDEKAFVTKVSGRILSSASPLSKTIVQILDSDDDAPPLKVSSTRDQASPRPLQNAPSGPKFEKNETGVLKRKRGSDICTGGNDNGANDNTRDVDDSCHTSKYKKIEAKLSPAANFSFGTKKSEIDFSPSHMAVLSKFQEKMRTNNFIDSSSSSSSDSEDDMDFSVPLPINFLQHVDSSTAHSRWEIVADILTAFEKDDELCMKAICALYRQEYSVKKSIFGSSTSLNKGFKKSAATRGTTLAEFLIDGDLQGKMKKSKEELMAYDHKGLDDCRRIAIEHSEQLFEIYQKQEDPVFLI